ncbi:MAG: hypothetical protein ABEJ76_03515 [Halanaeroarchaeum sp.]
MTHETDVPRVAVSRAAIAVASLLVVFAAVVPAAAVAAAGGAATSVGAQPAPDGAGVTVERTGPSEVTVRVPQSAIGANASYADVPIEVAVVDPDVGWTKTLTKRNAVDGSDDGVYRLHPFDALGRYDASLTNATVVVRIDGTEAAREHLPLHRIAFAATPPWTGENALYVPLNGSATVGVVENDTVTIEPDGGKPVEATVLAGATAVRVSLDAYRGAVANETRVAAFAGETRVSLRYHPVAPDLRLVTGRLAIWHPLVSAGTEYAIDLESGSGRYLNTTVAPRDGYLPLPDSLRGIEGANVTITHGNATLFDGGLDVGVTSVEAVRVDATTVRFGLPVGALDVSRVAVNGSTVLASESFRTDGRSIVLEGTTVASGQSMTLFTDAGVLTVETIQAPPPDGGLVSGGGLLGTILWLIGSVVVGGLVGFVSGSRLGFPSAQTLALGGIVLFALLVGGVVAWLLGGIGIQVSIPFRWEMAVGLVMLVGTYTLGGLTTGTESRTRTLPLTVDITNGATALTGPTTIVATPGPEYDREPRTTTIDEGRGRINLPEGRWSVKAKHGEYTSSPRTVTLRGEAKRVQLHIPLPGVHVTVLDDRRDEPLPDATVRMETGEKTDTERTGSDGRASFDPPADATNVTVTATHEKYDRRAEEYRLDGSGDDVRDRIRLDPQTGSGELVSRVDGVPASGVEVRVTPAEEFLAAIHEETTVTTGDDGRAPTNRLLVGRYRSEPLLAGHRDGLFDVDETTWRVREGETTDVSVDARFTWRLSAAQRDRIQALRDDCRAVTDRSGQDVAIPAYYASVVEGVLDAVESLPETGHEFATADVHPDDVADALLDAADRTVTWIGDAMSTKRNVDLFAACTDMPDPGVQWGGSIDVGEVVETVDGPMDQRRRVAARTDEVAERIDRERNDLSEVAPAREMLDQVSIDDHETVVETAAATVVDLAVLDAIEGLFEHRSLRDRLSRTVF